MTESSRDGSPRVIRMSPRSICLQQLKQTQPVKFIAAQSSLTLCNHFVLGLPLASQGSRQEGAQKQHTNILWQRNLQVSIIKFAEWTKSSLSQQTTILVANLFTHDWLHCIINSLLFGPICSTPPPKKKIHGWVSLLHLPPVLKTPLVPVQRLNNVPCYSAIRASII